MTDTINRQLRRMGGPDQQASPPVLDAITGLVPSNVNAESEFRRQRQD
ncbi:hypothetical protein [Spectribacter hydrogenoxidans]|uniref:Uncharacterized protein n=1 Tax=Spectribacter hydrogenoxidans TaxID=3075608 RepID=A0ABU3BWF8_9GAMM|nr:hypothetical protein [Salinisphaera sp. W335]MDT0633631.1 hypothetical protein [Salinisphaera sp. W335]